jgi:hypothetical protein
MLKKEMIWREILFQGPEKNKYKFRQQDMAEKFHFSLSTVFNALKGPRDIKAIRVGGRGFELIDPEKLLYLWATERKWQKDLFYTSFVSAHPKKIESMVPSNSIWGFYSAYEHRFGSSPSDYDKVFIYIPENDLSEIKKRFPYKKGPENLFVLRADPFLSSYGNHGTLAQIFADIWNTDDWYAKEFLNKLKVKMNL